MQSKAQNPILNFGAFLLIGLSLSIGWGIRGNFGHEYGAAFAGSLAAITAAILSGREDWRERIPYFAFYGAIGWGFGASVSYMQVLSYTESGHAISQWYGYLTTFMIGFLWAAMGSAGTTFVAVASKEQIQKLIKPVIFLFAAWIILDTFEDSVARWLQEGANFDHTWQRHKNPLYWFDADYLPAAFAAIGAAAYDLYERKGFRDRYLLPVFAVGGVLSGWVFQFILKVLGWDKGLASSLTYLQGDPTYINPATGQPAYEASNLLNNWPQWFGDYPQHIGWFIGLVIGIIVYFKVYGKFRDSSSLLAHMGLGWLIAFLVFPVFGSLFFQQYGGLRMTPPRSDDWAGITGVFVATSLWLWKNNLKPVAYTSVLGGIIGGLGFSGIQWLKQFFMAFGNPRILVGKGILPGTPEFTEITSRWANWQGQNWHSFLEQTYGFVNGIAIAVVMAFLVTRIKIHRDSHEITEPGKSFRWTRAFAVLFILMGLTYFNVVKNVETWGEQLNPQVWKTIVPQSNGTSQTTEALWDLPYLGRLPGVHFLSLTPTGWFNLTWGLMAIACIIIVVRHYKNPLPIVPKNPVAKGQLIFLILMWIMLIANFERALTGWHPSRLLTEWVIILNGIICTVLVLLLPKEDSLLTIREESDYKSIYKKMGYKAVAVFLLSSTLFLVTNRWIYNYPSYEKLDTKTYHTRFGPEASWRSKPNLKNAEHK